MFDLGRVETHRKVYIYSSDKRRLSRLLRVLTFALSFSRGFPVGCSHASETN